MVCTCVGNHKVAVFIIYSLGGVLAFVLWWEIKSEPKFWFQFTELPSWSSHCCASFPAEHNDDLKATP